MEYLLSLGFNHHFKYNSLLDADIKYLLKPESLHDYIYILSDRDRQFMLSFTTNDLLAGYKLQDLIKIFYFFEQH